MQHIFRAIKAILNEKILQQPKSMYQIRLGYVLLLTNSLLGDTFTLTLSCLTSILNTKATCLLVVIAATGFLMAKDCSKINIKMHLPELLKFCEVFTFVVNLSNVVDLSDSYRCLIMLESSQCERYLINICSIDSFDVLYFQRSKAFGQFSIRILDVTFLIFT